MPEVSVQALIDAELSVDQIAEIARVALAERSPRTSFPKYMGALESALRTSPPPFGQPDYKDVFRSIASNPGWMARSLIVNAEREGDGATRLWSMASYAPNDNEKQLLKRHAIDESGHSLGYLRLLDIVFPGSVTPEFREELNQLSPHYTVNQEPYPVEGSPYARVPSIDDYIQMNIAEIRTTIHHIMQREALAKYCAPENVKRMRATLDMLMRDELSHVAYTAELIEDKADEKGEDHLVRQFDKRMNDFNTITRKELGEKVFD
jgi:rubrerythrin